MAGRELSALTSTDLAALLSPLAKATAVGQLEWRLKKPLCHEGVIEVRTVIADCPLGTLRIYFVEPRPDRVHLQYLVNGSWVRRLDVNDEHRGVENTHKHTHIPATGREGVYTPDDIPEVPVGPTVAPGTYRRVFEAFAAECHIELPDGYWTEPRR